jgi:hypothetical protein
VKGGIRLVPAALSVSGHTSAVSSTLDSVLCYFRYFPRDAISRDKPNIFIPAGIRIGLDAKERLKAEPRKLSILYYQGDKAPCMLGRTRYRVNVLYAPACI